ncbi:hypothetical protein K504DRAFT_483915 [Pleomassaria siparia CBS 279.74]|uniref:CENP-V/GFA domain-containing protein n=1 Tax=Pleomassaria siparia CBS 279.74 TaxID=1314801 RepID=A0A6G1K0W5_9PLEO|nr:hypothetical protein K504DRAFT_483915 [Pleomassaria siparia CBS 279.74]
MSQAGGCICGNVRYEVSGEPAMKALCHCGDCRKISGSSHSTNGVYPEAAFKLVQGTPKTHTKKADSGNDFVSFFCPDCGTTLWRESKTFEGLKVVKVGSLDDFEAFKSLTPAAELYASQRAPWLSAVEGAKQADAMS